MSAVAVEHLTKRFGRLTAVRDVSFEVAGGQVTALLGPNGAGKTTTVEILAGLQVPNAGTVRVLGADPRARGRTGRSWRASIGVVLQSASLDAQLSVAEALRLFARLYPRPMAVGEVLAAIDMTADAGTKIGALSGGQRRRVDLAAGIIGRPELLFLDEPTTGLDPQARRQLWAVIENLTATGSTVLLTTHQMDEAEQLASRLIVLSGGEIVADGTPGDLRATHACPVIKLQLAGDAPVHDLPPELARSADTRRGQLRVTSADVTGDLDLLLAWARRNRVDLTGLQVGPPSLEEAYLALAGEASNTHDTTQEVLSHG
jgi:ABC-2 type transport system ATP-binding protein